jgi:uncharacterized protein YecE (DUF72 family)
VKTRTRGTLYAGTSGFSYPGWKGRFYPADLPASKMLQHYSSRLRGVELNGTFYRTPPEGSLRAWAATQPGFRLCLKAHRALTYSAAAFPKEQVARDFATRIAALGDHLGPVLLQFPPVRKRDLSLLALLLDALDRPVAAEFRDQSWFDGDVAALLRDRASAWAITDADDWPEAPPAEFAFAYYRLRREYDTASLTPWATRLRRELDRGVDVHAYFRHDAEGPFWALDLQAMVSPPLTDSV